MLCQTPFSFFRPKVPFATPRHIFMYKYAVNGGSRYCALFLRFGFIRGVVMDRGSNPAQANHTIHIRYARSYILFISDNSSVILELYLCG